MNHRSAAAVFGLTALLVAQRPTPTFEWQKRTTTLTYGALLVGRHTLSELEIGSPWRLGMGDASTWRLEMPILAGDTVIAPGLYRIQLTRTDETHCAILVNGSNLVLGTSGEARVVGALGKTQKPTKKLDLAWHKQGAAVAGNQPAKIVLQFGDIEWQGDVTIVGNSKTATVGAYKLTAFTLDKAMLDARDKTPVPIAVLSKGKDKDAESWNLVLGKSEAKLVPWMAAATDPFGPVVPPDAKLTTVGPLTVAEIKIEKPYETAELLASSLAKGELKVSFGVGQESLDVTVPEPKAKAGK